MNPFPPYTYSHSTDRCGAFVGVPPVATKLFSTTPNVEQHGQMPILGSIIALVERLVAHILELYNQPTKSNVSTAIIKEKIRYDHWRNRGLDPQQATLRINNGAKKEDQESSAKQLVNFAVSKTRLDNVTAIVVRAT